MKQQIPLDFNNLGGISNPNGMSASGEFPKGSYFPNGSYDVQMQRMNQPPMQMQQMNQQPPMNYNNNYPPQPSERNPNSINQDLNNLVRSELQSRGISMARSSPKYIREQEQEKKKMLLENIQNQMNLTKNTKIQELMRKRKEDEQYLKDMEKTFPFGRGGGGAPIRDKNGSIIATRRALISDPKYNLMSINVDDDYEDVWGKDKKIGMINFKNRTINMQNYQNPQNNFNNSGRMDMRIGNMMNYPNGGMQRNFSARTMGYNNNNQFNNQPPMYNNDMNGGVYQQNNFGYDNQNNFNNPPPRPYSTRPNNFNMQQQFQPQPQQQFNNGPGPDFNNYNNGPEFNNYNNGQNNFNNNFNNDLNFNNIPVVDQPFVDVAGNPNPNADNAQINISYENYELDEQKKRINKEMYRNDLLNQIQEKENRKILEKKKRQQEELEEEERLKRENEEIERKLEEERNRAKVHTTTTVKDTNTIKPATTIILDAGPSTHTHTKETITKTVIKEPENNKNAEEQLRQINQQEIESRMALNEEILKLRDQMQDQQANLFNQINSLKQETQQANLQRFEALQEIEKLKDELSKQRADEELRRKYVYDVIADDNSKIGGVYSQTHLPDTAIEKVVLPVHTEDQLYYDEKIRHPNRIIGTPKLDELNDNTVKTSSKFIDVDTHNVYNGIETYNNINPSYNKDPDEVDESVTKINNKGYEVNGDFGMLHSYYKEKPTTDAVFQEDVENNIKGNIDTIEDGSLEVNQIYNKNIERLRYLNDIESKLDSMMSKKESSSKENYDDFIGKINSTCTPNY